MRYLALVIVLLALPVSAAAQHSPSLPPIGLPLPPIGLPPEASKSRPWDGRPHAPWWENRQLPPWEQGHVKRPTSVDIYRRGNVDIDRRGHRNANVVYLWAPYPVAVYQEPQVIVVQQPPVTRIVEVEVPVPPRAPQVEQVPLPFVPEPPPFVPTGDRTLYVIPGCYVGNVPPQQVRLPANCDLSKVTTYVP